MKTNKLVLGILAHVDAGKTTLSENILYTCGAIRSKGRVDHGNTFLDTHSLERERGITIFSKQAFFSLGEWEITLLDTPGHVDFGTEMERTLQVLDYAILVINGNDGVQSHTITLWKLLERYEIPVFIFVNKMDRPENDAGRLLKELKSRLSPDCLDFGLKEKDADGFYEELALKEEKLLNGYLEGVLPKQEQIAELVAERQVFLVYFGSALKDNGVKELLEGINCYVRPKEYSPVFGARVFKIGTDSQNNRLTYVKITGGSLKVKQLLEGKEKKEGRPWQEKVDQIRLYSGDSYTLVGEVGAGAVCALTGLGKTRAGEGLGREEEAPLPLLEPVLTYSLKLQEGINVFQAYEKLEILCQEDPGLQMVWKEELQEIQVKVMGEIQLEVLKSLIAERFGFQTEFGAGRILYKETIKNTVEGVGHFEPLRHYAEVHLLLEPLPAGSGLEFATDCSEDMLEKNWQKLILTHLQEKQHLGVLTGSPVTDMRITLLSGKAHPKHTEGGDFRQATYRAIRQGLRKAEAILLEPVYAFTLEVPQTQVGRAMADIQRMQGSAALSEAIPSQEGMSILTGSCPVVTMGDYHREVLSYTQGKGRLNCLLKGYEPCHNQEEAAEASGYLPEADLENPCGSIFCTHGAGVYVEWDKVEEHMHLEAVYRPLEEGKEKKQPEKRQAENSSSDTIDTEEITAILNRTFYANKKGEGNDKKQGWRRKTAEKRTPIGGGRDNPKPKKEACLLVDGYNIIFAWTDLKELAQVSLDGARGKLMDILCDYQAMKGCRLILVFDAYRLQGHPVEILDYHNIHVVYTKEAQTADQYIEKFAHQHSRDYQITVATSDGLEQIIIRGEGCNLLSARELAEEIAYTKALFKEAHMEKQMGKHTLGEYLSTWGKELNGKDA
ncbi:MAG: NYN domain-containing protein [Lachnospiraceae bacterium]